MPGEAASGGRPEPRLLALRRRVERRVDRATRVQALDGVCHWRGAADNTQLPESPQLEGQGHTVRYDHGVDLGGEQRLRSCCEQSMGRNRVDMSRTTLAAGSGSPHHRGTARNHVVEDEDVCLVDIAGE